MKGDISKIINNASLVRKYSMHKKVKNIIETLKEVIDEYNDGFIEANNIDIKNNNGFTLDFDIINRIFNNIKSEDVLYGTVYDSRKDDKIMYGRELLDIGNVVVINDGNTYVILEMILKNLLACNNVIIVDNGNMHGVNHLLVELVRSSLEKYKIDPNVVQIYETDYIEEVLNKFASIDLVVCIGNHTLQSEVLSKTKNKTIISGYDNFDIFVESLEHVDFIEALRDLGLNIQLYVKDDLDISFDNEIRVLDLDEAIAQINYNGSKFSTCIFTDETSKASRFIREVKSTYITVNTSPTIERLLDIKTTDLASIKTVIYPNSLKLDGSSEEIKVD